jgi:hypothetical protein
MPSGPVRALAVAGVFAACFTLSAGQSPRPVFFPDDPIWTDDDRAFDASGAAAIEESDLFDFARNTFFKPGDRRDTPAVNANTIDELPDSSWFVNRIGRHPMSVAEIVRGPDRLERVDLQNWPVSAAKGEGLQAGYRVVSPEGHTWQVEFDPPTNPEMASGAEVIGTAFYHAFGYNVVDVYLAEFDPAKVSISPAATIRDPATGRRRPFTRHDLEAVYARGAQRPDGRMRAIVSRFAEGRPLGSFRYEGTRPDDPNDIHPHEHRRELRGNRVFAAWLNHDDSRGLNSLDMLEEGGGRQTVRHYMFDFGSIMGSGTIRAQSPRAGNEYILEWTPGLWTGLSLGLYFKPWTLIRYPAAPAAVGRFEGAAFRPESWKPEYPNTAFDNMRPEDAFWAARIVARFDEEKVRAVVGKAKYTDPRATDYVTRVLLQRREKVLRRWLNAVTPLVEPAIDGGRLTAVNAAIAAGVATAPDRYTAQWFSLDNATGTRTPIGASEDVRPSPEADGGVSIVVPTANADFVGVTIEGVHPEQPAWRERPATFTFRRTAAGWQHVGTQRYR